MADLCLMIIKTTLNCYLDLILQLQIFQIESKQQTKDKT
jgi:fructose-1-phosphate kinase PfkB-like protein